MITQQIADSIANSLKTRQEIISATTEMTELLTSQRVEQKVTLPGIPAINFPEALVKRTALRIRIYEGLFAQRPIARFINVKSSDQSGLDWYKVAREAADFFDYEARHGLGVLKTMRRCITEFVDYGTCVWKVHVDAVRDDDNPQTTLLRPKWSFVSINDLLFPEGYGPDISRLPWIGQVSMYNMSEVMTRYNLGIWTYDPTNRYLQVPEQPEHESEIAIFGEGRRFTEISNKWIETTDQTPSDDTVWYVAEIWYTDPETGVERVADIHLQTGAILRDVEAPHGRPYFKATLDERTAMSFLGLGAVEKLRPIQDVTNGVINSVLTTAIASNSQVRLIRSGSNLANILYGSDRAEQIGINFQAVTENPELDLRVIPLADPRGTVPAINMMALVQSYGDELFGTGPAQMGNVSVARRAPAYGVAAIMQQGGMPITDALRRLAEPMAEAVMFTFGLYEDFGPRDMPYVVLGDDGQFVAQTFSIPRAISKSLIVDVAIADPSTDSNTNFQKLITLFQIMQSWHTVLMQQMSLAANPQAPHSLRVAIANLAAKQQEILGRMLDMTGQVQDVDKLLFDAETNFAHINAETDELAAQLSQMIEAQQAMMAQQQQQQPGNGAQNAQ